MRARAARVVYVCGGVYGYTRNGGTTRTRRVKLYVCLCVRLCLTVCRLWMCCVHARESHAEDTQHENGFREAAPAGGMPDAVGRHTVAAL